jgi:hypothetical protein
MSVRAGRNTWPVVLANMAAGTLVTASECVMKYQLVVSLDCEAQVASQIQQAVEKCLGPHEDQVLGVRVRQPWLANLESEQSELVRASNQETTDGP